MSYGHPFIPDVGAYATWFGSSFVEAYRKREESRFTNSLWAQEALTFIIIYHPASDGLGLLSSTLTRVFSVRCNLTRKIFQILVLR